MFELAMIFVKRRVYFFEKSSTRETIPKHGTVSLLRSAVEGFVRCFYSKLDFESYCHWLKHVFVITWFIYNYDRDSFAHCPILSQEVD